MYHRFGLLHRIPPQSTDHPPGTTPPELQEAAIEYEEHELFVPADARSEGHYSAAQLAEWRQQEQEQWHQESLASRSSLLNHQESLIRDNLRRDYNPATPSSQGTPHRAFSPVPGSSKLTQAHSTVMNGNS